MNIYQNKFQFIYDNFTGGGGYEPLNSYSYLVKLAREVEADYKNRKEITTLTNNFTPLINIFIQPILAAEIKIATNNKNLNNVIEKGKLIENVNNIITNLKLYDQAYYGVEKENEFTIPEILNILPQDIIEVTTNNTEITEMQYIERNIFENLTVKVLCNYIEGVIIKKTLLWLNEKGEYTEQDLGEENRVKVFDKFIEEARIWKIGSKTLSETPNSFQLALTNYDIFNKTSLKNEILYTNAVSVLVIPTDQDISKLTLGAHNALRVPADVNKLPEYLEIDTKNFEMIQKDIDDKKNYLYKMFTNNLLADNIKYTTAISTMLASRSFNAEVNYLYNSLKIVLYKIINYTEEVYGIKTNLNIEFPEINYNTEELTKQIENIL